MSLSLGLVEFNSIAKGIEGADSMVKAADVQVVATRPVCPGKYIILVSGEISAVESSVAVGVNQGGQYVVDTFILPSAHPSLLQAFNNTNDPGKIVPGALGVIETFSVAAIIMAADVAAKASDVEVTELRVAVGVGGKGVALFTGDVSAVEAAVNAGAKVAADKGLLVQQVVIPSLDRDLWDALI